MATLEIIGACMVLGMGLIILLDMGLHMADCTYKIIDYLIGCVFGGLLAYLLYLSL